MASDLVPGFPAVTDAVERLRELDKELREDGVAFSSEASFHLSEITAALMELQGCQRAAQEGLEAETTENSKLAQHINDTKETIRREILADVAADRSNWAADTDQLQKDLMEVSQLQETTSKRQEDLTRQNEMLQAEKEQAKAEHEALVAALNDQIGITTGLQMQLNQSREQMEELASCSFTAEQDKVKLQKRLELDREAFAKKREHVCGEVEQVEEEIRRQKEMVGRRRKELARVNDAKLEAQEREKELALQTATLESSLLQVAASRSQCEKHLECQTQRHQQLKKDTELLEKERRESKVTSSTLIRRLTEEMNTLERETEEGRARREHQRDSLAHIRQTLKQQQAEEDKTRAELLRAEQRLQESKLQLDERAASIARRRREIREMDEQILVLTQASAVSQRLFQRDLQEMSSTVEAQGSTILHLEEEKKQLAELLETARSQQEERVAKTTSDIRSTERRYQELLQEEAALQEQQPVRLDADLLRRRLKQCEARYREEEARQQQEVERYTADADTISQSNKEKQRHVEEEEERLKEVEAAWRVEELRHTKMKSLVGELKMRQSGLELILLELKEKSGSLLQPRQEAKARLQEVQNRYMEMLETQTSELREAEMRLYDCVVKVEEVRMENSRFHLSIRQMVEEVSRAEEDGDRYRQETRLIGQEVRDASDSLRGRWKEDASVTRDHQSRAGGLLREMEVARSRLETRRQELENVSTLLQQQMLEFSRQLGDMDVPVQQSLSAAL